MRVYAAPTELADWLGEPEPPAGSPQALRSASLLVDEMLLCAVYPVDDEGYPTTEKHVDALREATCAQAEFAKRAGDARMIGAARPGGFTIGRLSVQQPASSGAGQAGGLGPRGEWSPQAWQILAQAGLTGDGPQEPDLWCAS